MGSGEGEVSRVDVTDDAPDEQEMSERDCEDLSCAADSVGSGSMMEGKKQKATEGQRHLDT